MAEGPLIAIVDDDPSIRRSTLSLLRAAGFATAAFEDAESFLVSAARATAACLVADMKMNGMSGLDLHEALAAAGDGIPTVLITAYPQEETRSKASRAGITCFLGKPFASEQLLECVREALARPRGGKPIPRS